MTSKRLIYIKKKEKWRIKQYFNRYSKLFLLHKKLVKSWETHCIKRSVFVVILVYIFSYSDWIWKYTKYLSVFSPNAGKLWTRLTPNTDTFHALCNKLASAKILSDTKNWAWAYFQNILKLFNRISFWFHEPEGYWTTKRSCVLHKRLCFLNNKSYITPKREARLTKYI